MGCGKRGAGLEIGDHACLQFLGERDPTLPVVEIARHAATQDHRALRIIEQHRSARDVGRGGRWCAGCGVARHVRNRCETVGLALLQGRVEVHIHRAAGHGLRDLAGAQQRFDRGGDRARLVVPFGEVAYQRPLIGCGVDPVDPGAPPRRVPRAGGAEHQYRRAIAPGVEYCHRCMHQPDVGMQHHAHHAARGLGISLRDCHRVFLVQAQQHLRRGVAQVVDQAVVQAAVAGPRVEGQPGHTEGAQARGDGVAAPGARCCVGGVRGF